MREREKDDVNMIVKIISFLYKQLNQPTQNMILKFSFVLNIKENPYHLNRPFQNSIKIKSTILLLLFLALIKGCCSKISNNKLWIIRNKLEIPSKNITNLYPNIYLGFSQAQFQTYPLLCLQRALQKLLRAYYLWRTQGQNRPQLIQCSYQRSLLPLRRFVGRMRG